MSALADLLARGRKLAGNPQNFAAMSDWYRISNTDSERAEMRIYGVIGSDFDDMTAGAFTRELNSITAPIIDLHLNSPGGSVFDGIAIYAALKNHTATVVVHIDGLAASAASFVAMAGDTISIEKPARMMVHDARILSAGNAADHQETADFLEELSDTIAEIYTDRAGGEISQWREKMRAETWFSSEQAVAAGLADWVNNASAPVQNLRGQIIQARHRARFKNGAAA